MSDSAPNPTTPPWRALNAALIEARANGPLSAISIAKALVSSLSLSSGTTLLIRPISSASRADIFGFRYHISFAFFLPTRSSRYQVPYPASKAAHHRADLAKYRALFCNGEIADDLEHVAAAYGESVNAMRSRASEGYRSPRTSQASAVPPHKASFSSMPSFLPPMQKNLSPAPVITITRVRVSRRISLMQSRIS